MVDQAVSPNLGAVVAVRGSVVDVRFEGPLPPIHTVLRAGEKGRIVIEVLAQRDARHVRGIALTPCFVVSMILIFANPFWNHVIAQAAGK